jgi:osmotically-inducible protein OsmY
MSDAWVAGVQSLDADDLKIRWWAFDEMKRRGQQGKITEDDIREAVQDALLHDPRVGSFNVDVSVEHRSVTLQGVVDNLKARRAAAQDARNTVGVSQVSNHLKVRPENPPPDEVNAQNVKSALLRDPITGRHEIDVSAHGGDVYLYGTVDSYFERIHGEDVAARVPGVVDVHNYLAVRNRGPIIGQPWFDDWDPVLHDFSFDTETLRVRPDSEIRREIERELFWSPFVDADSVTVAVEDGEATLTGTVDSWWERNAAAENALEGGAIKVRNRLEVR